MADKVTRAARPMGGALGAPRHRAHHLVGGTEVSKLTFRGKSPATIERSRLDKGSFHISVL